MDMTFNLHTRVSRLKDRERFTTIDHPSWPDLLTRMTAARQASAELAKEIREHSGYENGSFHQSAASYVAGQARSKVFVNLDDSGNGKADGAIASQVVQSTRTGGRG